MAGAKSCVWSNVMVAIKRHDSNPVRNYIFLHARHLLSSPGSLNLSIPRPATQPPRAPLGKARRFFCLRVWSKRSKRSAGATRRAESPTHNCLMESVPRRCRSGTLPKNAPRTQRLPELGSQNGERAPSLSLGSFWENVPRTFSLSQKLVPRRGLEPPRPCERQHLKLVRLPIPPSGHGWLTARLRRAGVGAGH